MKLNVEITDSTSATGTYTQGDKIKLGRNAGVTRPPETAWNQSGVNGHPSALDKVELSQVVSSKLFFTASYAYFRGGFQLAPVGGLAVNNTFQDGNGVWHNSYYNYLSRRPSNVVTSNGSYFFNTGPAGHEFKFGFSYRKAGVSSQTNWPGNGNYGEVDAGGPGVSLAWLTRASSNKGQLQYYNGYVGDVITFGNATINAGVRYDVQSGYNQGASTPANPVIPDILPALNGANEATQFTWKNWQPRVGITYAVGDAKKLVAKASYARFADQLGVGNVFHDNANSIAGIYYYWNDLNHDHVITRDELDFGRGPITHYGFDPSNPTSVVSPNSFDPNLKAGVTNEFLGGFDYEVMPELVVGAAYTHRKYTGFAALRSCTGVSAEGKAGLGYLRRGEFAATITGTRFDGTTFSVPFWLDGRFERSTRSRRTSEIGRPGFDTTYDGVELTWRSASNKWMMRGLQLATGSSIRLPTAASSDQQADATFGTGCPVGVAPYHESFPPARAAGHSATFSSTPSGRSTSPASMNCRGGSTGANVYGRQGYPFLQWSRRLAARLSPHGQRQAGLTERSAQLARRLPPPERSCRCAVGKVINVRLFQVNLSWTFSPAIPGHLQRQGSVRSIQRASAAGRTTRSPRLSVPDRGRAPACPSVEDRFSPGGSSTRRAFFQEPINGGGRRRDTFRHVLSWHLFWEPPPRRRRAQTGNPRAGLSGKSYLAMRRSACQPASAPGQGRRHRLLGIHLHQLSAPPHLKEWYARYQ